MKLSELASIPLQDLSKAAVNLNIPDAATMTRRSDLMEALAVSGVTMAQLQRALAQPAVAVQVSPSADLSPVIAAQDSLRKAVAGDMLMLDQRVGSIGAIVSALASENKALAAKLDAVDAILSKVPKSNQNDAVAKAVADAFKPIAAALKKAPVEVQAKAVALAPKERKSVVSVFDIPSTGADCEVWGEQGNFDPDYIFKPDQLLKTLKTIERGGNIWLWGERGTGKTMFASNLAARLGRPFFRVSFDANMERSEFVGADGLKEGNTLWQDGQVLQAYRTPGAICLLDEITAGRAEYLTALHAMLERNSVYVVTSTGERVERAHGMVFIAADNTNGTGDPTGRYAGTRSQNAALLDRFDHCLKIDFLPEKQEIGLLVKHGAEPDVAKKIVNVYTRCRAEVGNALVEPPSLRAAFAFCWAVSDGDAPEKAFESAVINKSPEEQHEALRQLFAAHWAK